VPDGAQRPAVCAHPTAPGALGCVRPCSTAPGVPGCASPAPQRYPLRRRRYWRHLGLYIKGRGTLRSGEQMHRRQGPLASFAPSGNTDKLAKLYV